MRTDDFHWIEWHEGLVAFGGVGLVWRWGQRPD